MRVAHVVERLSENGAFFAVDKECSIFCFRCRGGYMAEDACWVEDGTISKVGVVVVAKVEMAAGSAAGFGLIQVTGITVDVKFHATGFVDDCGIWVGVAVVKELLDGLVGAFGSNAFFGCEGAECDE